LWPANVYSGGEAELMLGRLLKSKHDQVVLASKAGMPHSDCRGFSPLSAEGLRHCVEGSLRRLNVQTIDLFYLHQPDRSVPLEDTLATVAELVAEGKVRALGVSNYSAWQIGDVIQCAESIGAPRPVVAQQLYNLVARRLDEEYMEFAATHAVHTMVYNPLAGGLLSGQFSFELRPTEGRFGNSRIAETYSNRYWLEEFFVAVERLSDIAKQVGITPAALALRWLAFREGVGSVVLGSSKVGHLRDNIAAVASGPLDPDVSLACDAVGADLRGPMPAYNR
jgi:aryl-alcohol dehydrogenase-like predicted oxidoreductase